MVGVKACFLSFSGGVGLFCILEFKEKRESLTDSEHLLLRFHTIYSESKVCNSIFDFSASISQLASRISQLASQILGIQFLSFADFSASILNIQVLIFSQGASRISHRHSDFRHLATPIPQGTSEQTRFYHKHGSF
ncbi:hypothetical protein LXL04_003651 [Taraxacum kok-saghyz]